MFKTDILFTGFYGYQNTGDDAFVEVASWGAERFWNKTKNRFLARKENLPHVLRPIKGYPFSLPRGYSIQKKLLLKNTDFLISAGGSTFNGLIKSSNVKAMAIKLKQKKASIKIGGIGVSIGPFQTAKDELYIEKYLKNIDFLAVRDQASFDYVSNLDNLPYEPVNAFDLAALLPDIYGKTDKIKRNKKTIGISVCQYESLQHGMDIKHEEKRNSMLVNLIKQLDEQEDLHFKFFVINGNEKIGDLGLTQQIINNSKPKSHELFSYTKETQKAWESIAQCDFMISTRLHAAIFACFSNTPFMLNEYHRKCGDFLDNVGYNKDYRLYDSNFDIGITANQILEIITDRDKYVKPTKVFQMQEQARLNFTSINI